MILFPLMQVLVDSALFFGLSSDEVVDPDAAVEQLETIASHLKQLSEAEKLELLAYFRKAAERESAEFGSTARADFLLSLGEQLGLC